MNKNEIEQPGHWVVEGVELMKPHNQSIKLKNQSFFRD